MLFRSCWTDGLGIYVEARTETSARRKIERLAGCAVETVRRDHEAEAWAELPDCDCGWRGRGSGRVGAIVRGDRCPDCGQPLD